MFVGKIGRIFSMALLKMPKELFCSWPKMPGSSAVTFSKDEAFRGGERDTTDAILEGWGKPM